MHGQLCLWLLGKGGPTHISSNSWLSSLDGGQVKLLSQSLTFFISGDKPCLGHRSSPGGPYTWLTYNEVPTAWYMYLLQVKIKYSG